MVAAQEGHSECLSLLLSHGAEHNRVDVVSLMPAVNVLLEWSTVNCIIRWGGGEGAVADCICCNQLCI